MKFITLAEKQLQTDYLCIREPHLLISISGADKDPNIPKSMHRKGLLSLKFDDVEDMNDKYMFFTQDQAKQILSFINADVDRVNTIVIQCMAGISRSVAVASALSKIMNNSDDEIFSKGVPNMFVYTTILDCYFGDPDLKQKWTKIWYLRNRVLKDTMLPALHRIAEYKVEKREKEV